MADFESIRVGDRAEIKHLITDNDINFVYIVGDEPGLYINADMLIIDTDALTELTKLLKFEETFKTTMEPLLRQRKTN